MNSKSIWYAQLFSGTIAPPVACRTTIRYNNNTILIEGYAKEQSPSFSDLSHSSIDWTTSNTSLIGSIDPIIHGLQLGTVKVVSDGSFRKEWELGTAAWTIINNNDTTNRLHGKCISPGPQDQQNPYRSELVGIRGAISTVNSICQKYNITEGSITCGCDGKSALEALVSTQVLSLHEEGKKHLDIKQFDVIHSIQSLLKASPLTWKFGHVYGHQDKFVEEENLDIWAQINILSDSIAKGFLFDTKNSNSPIPSSFPNEPSSIVIQTSSGPYKICSNLKKTLTKIVSKERLLQYWRTSPRRDKRSITTITEPLIDWITLKKATKMLQPSRRRWLSKSITGICGVGICLQRWKWQYHSKCPRCGSDGEDFFHVLTCDHPEAQSIWIEHLTNIKKWMLSHNAGPELPRAICGYLHSWRFGSPPPNITSFSDIEIHQSILEQHEIGWKSMFDGLLSRHWSIYQTNHLRSINKRQTGTQWIAILQKKIWELSRALWEHRNKVRHPNDKDNIHLFEKDAVDLEIRHEYRLGLKHLPHHSYKYLFEETLGSLLKRTYSDKHNWLASVWNGRDIYANPPCDARKRNVQITGFYDQWKRRRKKRRLAMQQ